ncbi:MAG: hypothetical protein JWL90_330 [Chthoniobacteraceae bacterium]|nr:hypothetical protein [Chthoniobacteraceae bacterium]
MPRYDHPSKFFADDKDVADLLDAPKFTKKKLLSLALDRGIILSGELPRETIRDHLSRMPFSWVQLRELLDIIETADVQEKETTCRYESAASSEDLQKVLSDVREIRGETADESYVIRKTETATIVRITYREVDHMSTRTMQRTHKEMEIFILPTEGGYDFRYPANGRAHDVVEKITDMLPVPEGKEKPKRQTVELSGVIDPAMRTEFFIRLMDGMEGFKRRDVIDLKLHRIPQEAAHEDDEDGEEEKEKEAEIKGLVKRLTLTGEALLSSPEFGRLKNDGFCIGRTIWEAKESTGSGRVFEIEAQFRNPEGGTGFCYLVRGVHNINDEGDVEVTKRAISLDDRKRINEAIEAAAYAAVLAIREKIAPRAAEKPKANGA